MVTDDRIGASACQPERAAGVTGAAGSTGAAGPKTGAAGAAGAAGAKTDATGAAGAAAKTDAAGAAGATPQPGPGEYVRRVIIPATAAMAIAPNGPGDAAQIATYLEQVQREAGNPTDPIRCMLVQQFAVAHLRGLNLHVKSAVASTAEEAGVYSNAAAKIMGEMGKLALVIRQLEARATPKPNAPAARPTVAASPADDPPHTRPNPPAARGTARDGARADAPDGARADNDPDFPLGKQAKDPDAKRSLATKAGAGEAGPVPGARRRRPRKSEAATDTD